MLVHAAPREPIPAMPHERMRAQRSVLRNALPLGLLLACGACSSVSDLFGGGGGGGGGGGTGRFQPRSTSQATARDGDVVITGRWLVFFASEATTGKHGTDFNGDGDFKDPIAVVVDLRGSLRRVLDVAVQDALILGDQIFLIADEQIDGRDWDLDGLQDNRVLLHWSRATDVVDFVSTLGPDGMQAAVQVADRLYFSDDPAALAGTESTINFVEEAMPTVPVRVSNVDATASPQMRILAEDDGLLFLYQDEVLAARDLNGDGDADDEYVLALLDTTDPAALIRSVGLALRDQAAPVAARATGTSDWIVGFLVDETAQGETNLNDPALFDPLWQPPQCAGREDVDAEDRVLHFLRFATWNADPVASPPVNTGLVGIDRVVAVAGTGGAPGAVGTISDELDEGGCSLNGDEIDDGTGFLVPDQGDRVFRWVEAQAPALPVTDEKRILAVSNARGGTDGVTRLNALDPGGAIVSERFVVLVNENADQRDLNGDGRSTLLLGWLDPSQGPTARWNFDQAVGSGFYVGTRWMAETDERARLLISIQENVVGAPLNAGDSDMADSVPTISSFNPLNPADLNFPGPPVAVDENDSGMVIAGDQLFYRVAECDDATDWNRDGDTRDIVLFRSPLADLTDARFVVTLTESQSQSNTNCSDVSNPPPQVDLFGGGGDAGAYVANENRDRKDYNKDGDRDDFVVRWFRL